VRVAAFASAAVSIVPAALARFRLTNPGVRVLFSQLETDASYAQLQRGDLDLALTFDYGKIPYPAPGRVLRTLITEDPVLVAVAAEDWIAASLAGLQLNPDGAEQG
jgi:DNA-binding transcriptional LysR family regulator